MTESLDVARPATGASAQGSKAKLPSSVEGITTLCRRSDEELQWELLDNPSQCSSDTKPSQSSSDAVPSQSSSNAEVSQSSLAISLSSFENITRFDELVSNSDALTDLRLSLIKFKNSHFDPTNFRSKGVIQLSKLFLKCISPDSLVLLSKWINDSEMVRNLSQLEWYPSCATAETEQALEKILAAIDERSLEHLDVRWYYRPTAANDGCSLEHPDGGCHYGQAAALSEWFFDNVPLSIICLWMGRLQKT